MVKTPAPNDDSANGTNGTNETPKPTDKLPMHSAPVSATAAASGGQTGLQAEKERRPSIFRRHPLVTGIAAGAVAVVLVSGLTAWGVGAAVTASLTSSTSSELPMTMPTTTPAPGAAAGASPTAGRLAVRATIQSMDGDSWTVLTRKGTTVTLTVDSTTKFGTKSMPTTAGSFAVGDSVIIVATRGTDGMPVATRVVKAPTAS